MQEIGGTTLNDVVDVKQLIETYVRFEGQIVVDRANTGSSRLPIEMVVVLPTVGPS